MRSGAAILLLLVASLFASADAAGQLTFNGSRTISNDIYGYDNFPASYPQILSDGNGNIYIAGEGDGYRVAKYNHDGALLWHRVVSTGGQCTFSQSPRLARDSQGNVVLLYQKWYAPASACRCGLTKFDPNGNELWTQTSQYPCFEIGIDGADGVNVAGSLSTYFYTQKFSSGGVFQWATPHQANYVSYHFGVAGHTDGSVYTLTNGPQTNNDDIVIMKYNAAGVLQWTATYNGGTNADDWPGEMTLDASGNVYVVGYSDPNGENNATAVHDIVTLKYSASGQQQWAKRHSSGQTGYGGGDLFYDPWLAGVALDAQGNVIVTGRLPGGTATKYDYAAIKYDANGNEQWARTFNHSANCDDMASDVAVGAGGNVYVAGASEDACSSTPTASLAVVQYDAAGNPIGSDRRPGSYYYTFNGSLYQAAMALSPQGAAFVLIGNELRKYACVAVDPANVTVAYQATSGTIGVTSHSGCAANWTAVSNAAWITVTSGSSGSGNGTVGYSIAANNTGARRIGTITIGDATFTVIQNSDPCVLATPSNLIATYDNSSNRVVLTWNSVAGTIYELQRKVWYSSYETRSSTATSPYLDDFTFFGTTYLYRVRAVSGCTMSPFSNLDVATNYSFTDDPIVAGTTVVKAVHITQLRETVNAVRKLAMLPNGTYTDASLTGVFVKAAHISELRTQLDAALTNLGIPLPSYTDPSLSAGTAIRRAHVQELRDIVK